MSIPQDFHTAPNYVLRVVWSDGNVTHQPAEDHDQLIRTRDRLREETKRIKGMDRVGRILAGEHAYAVSGIIYTRSWREDY